VAGGSRCDCRTATGIARGESFGLANAQPRNRASLDGHKLAYLALEGNPRPLTLGIMMMQHTRRTQTVNAFLALCHEVIHDQRRAVAP
jgi:hypothetical protein